MSKVFQCRERGGDDEDWTDTKGYDPEDAAETYADDIWPYSDNAEDFEIEVKDSDGKVTLLDVTVDFYPSFHASPFREKRKP